MALKILQHGAEAIILKRGNEVIKKRIKKSYRLVELDEKIRKQRTKSEAKLLNKASEIINSPKPLPKKEKFEIYMPFIKGKKLSEHLDKFSLEKQKQICTRVGENIAKLHDKDIIHGDLTTSNMILVEDEKDNFRIFFIDFGLGFISRKIEDRAVDLHLLRQALEAKHFRHWKDLFHSVIRGYQNSRFQEAKKVFERLKAVEKRGRYKH